MAGKGPAYEGGPYSGANIQQVRVFTIPTTTSFPTRDAKLIFVGEIFHPSHVLD